MEAETVPIVTPTAPAVSATTSASGTAEVTQSSSKAAFIIIIVVAVLFIIAAAVAVALYFILRDTTPKPPKPVPGTPEFTEVEPPSFVTPPKATVHPKRGIDEFYNISPVSEVTDRYLPVVAVETDDEENVTAVQYYQPYTSDLVNVVTNFPVQTTKPEDRAIGALWYDTTEKKLVASDYVVYQAGEPPTHTSGYSTKSGDPGYTKHGEIPAYAGKPAPSVPYYSGQIFYNTTGTADTSYIKFLPVDGGKYLIEYDFGNDKSITYYTPAESTV